MFFKIKPKSKKWKHTYFKTFWATTLPKIQQRDRFFAPTSLAAGISLRVVVLERQDALQPLWRCDAHTDIKAGCDLIPRNEGALAKGRHKEGGRCRAEERGAKMRGRGESKMSQWRRKTVLGSEGWEEKCNLGPDRGVTVQFVCGVMERRWLGSADKSGPAWTGRIREDLRSLCKIFRWTDVWRGQEKRGLRPQPVQKNALVVCIVSWPNVPVMSPKMRRHSASKAGGKDGARRSPAMEMHKPQAKFYCCVSVQPFSLKLPEITFRLLHRGSLEGRALLLVHLQFFSLPLYASLEAGKQQRCGGLARLFFWLTGSVRLGIYCIVLIVWKCRRFTRSPAG